jgi:serine phosphatase RsbU (regulator of sigma subunit)
MNGTSRTPQARFLFLWALGWGVMGLFVAGGLAFAMGHFDFGPIVSLSLLFAEVVGFAALTSARAIFPYFKSLPAAFRVALQVMTLLSGAIVGSILAASTNPLYVLAHLRTFALVICLNAAIATAVGIAISTYDSMRRQIERSFQTLREKEAIERQVEIAREVQKELFPKSIPQVRGLELVGVCQPAIGVGGDYYDFLPLGDDRVGLVVADVSGKGIPAALLMASLQAAVRGLVLPNIGAAEINRRLNEVLFRSTSASRYATLFFGVYDANEGALTYSNAGHNPPLQISGNAPFRLSSGGIPLGVLGDSCYDQEKLQLTAGDLLVLYTDGVTEATDPGGREFGEERLIDLLTLHRSRNFQDLIPIVLGELEKWTGGGPPHDDLTLVLARAS